MRQRLAQRELALACVALLAAAVALTATAGKRSAHRSKLPVAVGSYVALAGSAGPEAFGRKTACGGTIEADTEGITHPTLPCGTKVYVTFHGRRVLTVVVDRGPYEPGRQFDVTDALARRLGLGGVQEVTWSYAGPG